jgi:hypothetical protein
MMKKYGLKWWLNAPLFAWRKITDRLLDWLSREMVRKLELGRGPAGAACSQIVFQLEIRKYVQEKRELPPLNDLGFKMFSQTNEDGILLALFAIIGTQNKKCVEICAGDGLECNCANLILHHSWQGLLVDGNEKQVARGRAHFQSSPHTFIFPPVFAHAWVTRGNVNELMTSHGFSGEIDLLSLDMDGVDYWIWEAITVITPRVVVLEYADDLGPDVSWTVPYSDDFYGYAKGMVNDMPNFAGASLAAFVKLATRKGYRLVAINSLGFNAFFIREDLAKGLLPTLEIKDCFSHPKVTTGRRDRFPLVKDMPWVEV